MQTPIRRPRYMPLLYVAAVVSLVAAGALLLVAEPTPRNSGTAAVRDDATLDRCAAAVNRAGKSALFPSVSTWRTVFTHNDTPDEERTVLGVATDNKPFFCAVTETTVTISDPNAPRNYAAGSQTALLLLTKDGVAAGVADPSWPAAFIYSDSKAALELPVEGLFIHEIGVYRPPVMVKRTEQDHLQAPAGSDFTGGVELPQPAPPAVSVVDRPTGPVDRTSELGKKLGSCLAGSDQAVLDPDTYNPGASIGTDLIAARSATRIGACASGPGQTTFRSGFSLSSAGSSPLAFYPGHLNMAGGGRPTLAGSVPTSTTRMVIRFGDGTTVHPVVANKTFAVVIPPQVELAAGDAVKDEDTTTVWLYGANGTMTYSGTLQFWRPPTR